MSAQTITQTSGHSPRVRVRADEALHIIGWDREEITVTSRFEPPAKVEADAEGFRVHSAGEVLIRVPHLTDLQVEQVAGKATIQDLAGPLHLARAGANVTLQGIGTASMDSINGNLTASGVSGDLIISEVYGNASLEAVAGRVQVQESVHGRLTLVDCAGVDARALGNASLRLGPTMGTSYRLESLGNLSCQLSEGASAHLEITSRSRSINLALGDDVRMLQERTHQLTLGEGEAEVFLEASGHIHVYTHGIGEDTPEDPGEGFTSPAGDLAEEIIQQIDQQMASLEARLSEHLADFSLIAGPAGLPPEEIDGIVEQARKASQRAALQAQQKARKAAQRAQERLERKLEKARRKSQSRGKGVTGWRAGARASPTYFDSQPEEVSEQERLLILKMLEDGQISLEEAEQLLAALEGDQA